MESNRWRGSIDSFSVRIDSIEKHSIVIETDQWVDIDYDFINPIIQIQILIENPIKIWDENFLSILYLEPGNMRFHIYRDVSHGAEKSIWV